MQISSLFDRFIQAKASTIIAVGLGCLAWSIGYALIWLDYFQDYGGRYLQLMREGMRASQGNDFSLAEKKLQAAQEIAKRQGDSLQLAQALMELADVYERSTRYKQAAQCIEKALGLYREMLASKTPGVTAAKERETEVRLANAYYRDGDWPKAEALYKKLVSKDTLSLVELDVQSSEICSNYINLLKQQGKHQEARTVARDLRTIGYASKRGFPAQLSACVAAIKQGLPFKAQLESMLATASQLGQAMVDAAGLQVCHALLDEAEKQVRYGGTLPMNYIEEAEQLCANKGPVHWRAQLLIAQSQAPSLINGQNPSADQLAGFETAISEMKAQDGEQTMEMAAAYELKGRIHEFLNDHRNAAICYRNSNAIKTKFMRLSPNARFSLGTLTRLANSETKIGNSKAASAALDKALVQARKAASTATTAEAQYLEELGGLLLTAKRNQEAEEVLRACRAAWVKHDPNSMSLAGVLNLLAHIELADHKSPSRAEALYIESQAICKRSGDVNALASTMTQRACMYVLSGRRSEAKALLEEALKIVKDGDMRASINVHYQNSFK